MAASSGDGTNPPFGNGAGATSEVGATPSSGTDFTQDVNGKARKSPVDNSKLFPNRAQKMGAGNFSADSVAPGGRILLADPAARETNGTRAIGKGTHLPFKIKGGGQPADEFEGGSEE